MSVVGALTTAVLPVLAVAAAGYALGTVRDLRVDALNEVTLQVLLPALVFHSLATTSLGGADAGRVVGGVVVFVCAMLAVAESVGRLTDTPEPIRSALVLAATFPNSGNFGIPLAAFAFGATGRTVAVLFVTAQNVLVYTVGVYVAARGHGRPGRGSVTEIAKLPLVYAAGAALLARAIGVVPPAGGPAMRTLGLVGDASIPLMLLILGVQLTDVEVGSVTRVVTPTVLKLGVAPAVGLLVALVVGLGDGTVGRVFVLECATPTAVLPLVLVLSYEGPPSASTLSASEYLSTTVLVTTLASVAVLTGLIAALRSGAVL